MTIQFPFHLSTWQVHEACLSAPEGFLSIVCIDHGLNSNFHDWDVGIGHFPFVFLTMKNIAMVANWLEVALASISVESISIAESYGKLI